ncbi:MAG: Asp23/Gls24 family envelope stress response protein [Spirochaetales bacterium]
MKYPLDGSKNTSNKGKVNCNKNILLSIINLAAKEISGVSRMAETFGSHIRNLISNNYYEGVKIAYNNNDALTINVYLNVYYGVKVADVVYRVQENIKNGLSSMIDVKINTINVHILGVDFKKEKD